ncbi:hypothetical protein [Microbacterium sp. 77mftsu3.1]|uniref:hypothetical protein n=1 Tax=Microbacterium sp. 77mftsu3.1 TaxID=1761802 RepID=UPI000375C265|nr:hypothetical protein [Microbacterium sp. 77mftsu3.1]SDH35599.1 hypothetical protein SAMN04488590_3116 [Microbacterium sp. 77mftsu3.1]
MSAVEQRREDHRHGDGTFGKQDHTEPEATLTPEEPTFTSEHGRRLEQEVAQAQAALDKVKDERREQHLIEMARYAPADVEVIVFRGQRDEEGTLDSLFFDHAEDEANDVSIDPAVSAHLYTVAWDFGSPGDYAADQWLDTDGSDEEEEVYYRIDLDEGTALLHAQHYRDALYSDTHDGGLAPLQLRYGLDAWTERTMRTRAHKAGITNIYFGISEELAGVQVVAFDHVDHGRIAPDDADGDHMFIVGQGQEFAHPTEAMVSTGDKDAPLSLKV